MNTKHCFVIAGILLLLSFIARAADAPIPVAPEAQKQFYREHEFQIDGFYQTVTPDFEQETGSMGIGVGFFLTRNFGARFSSSVNNLNGPFIDNVSLHALYRVPIERTALYGYGGSTRLIKAEEWTVDLGVGIEHRFSPRWGPFAEAGMSKLIDHGAEAVGKVGLRLSF